MEFNIENRAVFRFGDFEIWLTDTIISTWVIMTVLIVAAVIVRIKLRKFSAVPSSGFQNAIEMIIEAFNGFLKNSAGEKLMYLGGWFFTVITFILVSNISGLFFLRPPTADWTVTFMLALVTFFLIQFCGVRHRKMEYLKNLCQPGLPLLAQLLFFLPLNIIGELARPVSLSFRLFGNVLGGMILMGLLYNMAPIFVQFGIPAAIHGFFDVIIGILQAYIFCLLSLSFIGAAAATAED